MRKSLEHLLLSTQHYFAYRQRFSVLPGFLEAYITEKQALMIARTRVLSAVGIVLHMSFHFIERLSYPEFADFFFVLRIGLSAAALVCLMSGFISWSRRYIGPIFFCALFAGDLAFSWMSAHLGGWTSLYFVGNITLICAATMFVPWSPRTTLIYCTLSLLAYLGINSLYHPFAVHTLVPAMLLLSISVLSYFSTISGEISRMEQLASRLEIQKSHEELKRLDEAKTRFFSNISHELRTPLTLIIGPLESLMKGTVSPSKEFVHAMITNARRLLRQVNSLLDLSKMDSGQMKCSLDAGNIGKMLSDLGSAARPGMDARKIRLIMENLDQIPDSLFDFEKIETVAANLISNAVKFSPAGGSIAVSCEVYGDKILFSVRDTGPGVPADSLTKVFERFHQVDNSSTRATKGTGLGLSVAKEFVELHGGRIWLTSQPGQGAHFQVELPLLKASASEQGRQSANSQSTLLVDLEANEGAESFDKNIETDNENRFKQCPPHRPVILYSDDNKDLRQFVSSLLAPHYTVLLAQDGQQGLEQARKYAPSLILSDLMMPRMSGTDFCRQVRSDSDLKATPFVLLTAKSALEDRIEGLEDGADDYLSKPFSEQELLARIKNLVKLRQQQLENKRQLQAAREIQRALLPDMNQIIGPLSVEAIYRPCDELSGDFFDIIRCQEWTYVYVADVTSHGVASAQVTYLIKEMFAQTLAANPDLDLIGLFDRVRSSYIKHQLNYDVCLQLIRINHASLMLENLRSNGCFALLYKDGGPAVPVDTGCSPSISSLSADASSSATVTQVQLAAGQSVYMHTDGATEFQIASGADFGDRRLSQLLRKHEGFAWSSKVMDDLSAANSAPGFPDDLTIVRVHVRDSSQGQRTA